MLAALKAKMEKERKIILNLSYNSKAHNVGLFLSYILLFIYKAGMFSAVFHPID
jgi:hypothetical protein